MHSPARCQPEIVHWVDRALDSLLPPRCLHCRALAPLVQGLCSRCQRNLRPLGPACPRCALPLPHALATPTICGGCLQRPHAIDQAWAGFRYGEVCASLIRQLKFSHQLAAAQCLGRALAQLPCPLGLAQDTLLIPAPLHLSRLRQRGFNQALELCRTFAQTHTLEIDRDILIRQHPTQEQTRLNAAQRRRNVHQAFVCRRPLKGESVLLFDDVMTTGATMKAMAQTLRQSGAGHISAIAIARA